MRAYEVYFTFWSLVEQRSSDPPLESLDLGLVPRVNQPAYFGPGP